MTKARHRTVAQMTSILFVSFPWSFLLCLLSTALEFCLLKDRLLFWIKYLYFCSNLHFSLFEMKKNYLIFWRINRTFKAVCRRDVFIWMCLLINSSQMCWLRNLRIPSFLPFRSLVRDCIPSLTFPRKMDSSWFLVWFGNLKFQK